LFAPRVEKLSLRFPTKESEFCLLLSIRSPDERSDIRELISGSLAAPGSRFAHPGYKIKRRQNADKRVVNGRTCRCSAAPAHSPPLARGGKREGSSPVGVLPRFSPGRQLVPKAQRQAMLSGTVRSARSYGPPTGARIERVSTGVTRAGTETYCPHPVSTSRAGAPVIVPAG
jgi:hypothetical protein